MNKIFITVLGVVLVILGFYAMSFGFSSPPNISLFFIGLVITVFGGLAVILFGSQIDLKSGTENKNAPKTSARTYTGTTGTILPKSAPEKIPTHEKPVITKKSTQPKIKKLVTDKRENPVVEEKKPIAFKEIKPKRKAPETVKSPIVKSGENKTKEPKEIKPVTKKPIMDEKKVKNESESVPKGIKPVSIDKKVEDQKGIRPVPVDKEVEEKPKKLTDKIKSPFTRKKVPSEDKIEEEQEMPEVKRIDPSKLNTDSDTYVKDRLNILKDNTLNNAEDIENLIEERLDSFKGTLNQIKSESKDPSIIWSFDAGDVQQTMQDTILKADKKILMMYPWIRNIDVGVLRKIMDTESRLILQEASLDDDASVELIKLLLDNKVEIRTMHYVHTVAIVSDQDNGLIISTDPIYESFEVGVIYKDQKSIEEIERMFDEAWELSKAIDLS